AYRATLTPSSASVLTMREPRAGLSEKMTLIYKAGISGWTRCSRAPATNTSRVASHSVKHGRRLPSMPYSTASALVRKGNIMIIAIDPPEVDRYDTKYFFALAGKQAGQSALFPPIGRRRAPAGGGLRPSGGRAPRGTWPRFFPVRPAAGAGQAGFCPSPGFPASRARTACRTTAG